jgi:hypothetical protein
MRPSKAPGWMSAIRLSDKSLFHGKEAGVRDQQGERDLKGEQGHVTKHSQVVKAVKATK